MARYEVLFVEGEDDPNGWLAVEPGYYWGETEADENEEDLRLFVSETVGPFETREAAEADMRADMVHWARDGG